MTTPTDGANILDPIEFYHCGATAFFASQRDQRFSYCLYVPQAHQRTTTPLPLFVIVHGTQRTAERYRDAYRDFAEQNRCVVLASLFPAGIAEPGDLPALREVAVHRAARELQRAPRRRPVRRDPGRRPPRSRGPAYVQKFLADAVGAGGRTLE